MVVEVTPVSVANIGWRTYLIWAVLNLANAIIVWLFYPETAGIPLEQIDLLFTERVHEGDEKTGFFRKLQWSVVGRASAEVKKQRKLRRSGPEASEEAISHTGSEYEKSEGSLEHVGVVDK